MNKQNAFVSRHRASIWLVGLHSIFVIIATIAVSAIDKSGNPEFNAGCFLGGILSVVDMPVTALMAFVATRVDLTKYNYILLFALSYGILGNIWWFLIGLGFDSRAKKPNLD